MLAVSDTRRRWRKAGHFALLFVGLGLMVLWIFAARQRLGLINRDWVAFDRAGWRALSGDWVAVYRESASERWPYLYPPFAIPLSIPLGMLPYEQSYQLSFLAVLGAMWWSCRRLREVVGHQEGRYLVFCSALLVAPSTLQVLITGQYSWLYCMALAALAAAPAAPGQAGWEPLPPLLARAPIPGGGTGPAVEQRRGAADAASSEAHQRRAAYCLVLLTLKPNMACFAAAALLVGRQHQLLRRWITATTVVVALTAPFAWAAWADFGRAVVGVAQRQESGAAPVDKQATLLAFLRVLSGDLSGSAVVWVLWLVLVVPLLVLGALAWRRLAGEDLYRLRLVGLLSLVMVAANPRLYFYDAVVIALAAAGWYLDRASYRRIALRRVSGACLGAILVASFTFFISPSSGTAIGALAGLWALCEAVDLLGRRPCLGQADAALTAASLAMGDPSPARGAGHVEPGLDHPTAV